MTAGTPSVGAGNGSVALYCCISPSVSPLFISYVLAEQEGMGQAGLSKQQQGGLEEAGTQQSSAPQAVITHGL